jgi:mannose-6-phosphate isomerase class I
MEADGSIRSMQIEEYFDAIDRDPAANDPANHMSKPKPIRQADGHSLGRLMTSRHYTLDKLTLSGLNAKFDDTLNRFVHLFVKSGRIQVTSGSQSIIAGTTHSCFIPAAASEYQVKNLADSSEILISY